MSLLGRSGGARRTGGALFRRRLTAAVAGTAAAVIVAGCGAASASGSGKEKVADAGNTSKGTQSQSSTGQQAASAPLRLLSVTPKGGTKKANGGAQITLTFSAALSPSTPLPTLSPKIAGSWKVSGKTATFTPSSGFLPDTKVTVSAPGGAQGMTGAAGTTPLAKTTAVSYTTGSYSVRRLQQLLAELGYLPMTWAANSGSADPGATGGTLNAQVSDAYDPPSGSFTFKSGYPTELTSQWKVGKNNELVIGAVRAFESDQGLTMDGDAGPGVWSHLLTAAVKDQANQHGYTYALASQNSPESLKVWHNGKVILNSPANTGIAGASTVDGTFPVYERLSFQIMKGKNPDGTKYADPVYWVAYFNGGDAVHYFDRYSYGYYQSLGCVELPWTAAKSVWPYLTYGSLVTVTGPVS